MFLMLTDSYINNKADKNRFYAVFVRFFIEQKYTIFCFHLF
jgi:hypothetical protein